MAMLARTTAVLLLPTATSTAAAAAEWSVQVYRM
jgi:hypothetical protein